MKQLYSGAMFYVNDFNDCLPPDGGGSDVEKWADFIIDLYISNEKLYSYSMDGLIRCQSTTPLPATPGVKVKTSYCGTIATWDADPPSGPYGGLAYSGSNVLKRYYGKRLNRVTDGSVLIFDCWLYDSATNYGWSFNSAGGYGHYAYTNSLNIANGYGAEYRHNMTANFLFKEGNVTPYRYGKQFDDQWRPTP
jgi:hypothetical protein